MAEPDQIINAVGELFKYMTPMIGAVWYISHRLTKIEGSIKENNEASIARDKANISEVKLVKSDLKSQIQAVEGTVTNLDTKLNGEIKEAITKLSLSAEKSVSELSIKVSHLSSKVEDIDRKFEKSVRDVEDNVKLHTEPLKSSIQEICQRVNTVEENMFSQAEKKPTRATRKKIA